MEQKNLLIYWFWKIEQKIEVQIYIISKHAVFVAENLFVWYLCFCDMSKKPFDQNFLHFYDNCDWFWLPDIRQQNLQWNTFISWFLNPFSFSFYILFSVICCHSSLIAFSLSSVWKNLQTLITWLWENCILMNFRNKLLSPEE